MQIKARNSGTNKKQAERPVSAGIRRAARRAGITTATLQAVDADAAIAELREAFEEVFDATGAPCGEHDALVLCALRRLRLVQGMIRGSVEVVS
ncbi:MAG: hypothetical protein ABJB12_03890 [Pseudomonadota bacterium]